MFARRLPRPFEQSYAVTLAIALLALIPFIIVTTAVGLFQRQVSAGVGIGGTGAAVVSGLATAGYAFGALLAGDLIQRFPQRPLFLACETLFVAGSAVTAAGTGPDVYGAGRVLQGLATGLLLVVALPPVIQRFGAARMPTTAACVNIGFFGAVAAGPLLGGAVAAGHAWRAFFAGLGAVGLLAIALALVTLPDRPPPNPDLPLDRTGIGLAAPATVLPFFASGELTGHGFGSFGFMVPLAVGVACLVALLLVEFHKTEPLAPVKPMWTTIPVAGTLVAMIGGGAFVAFLEIAENFQLNVVHRSPLSTGLLFWPQVVGVLVTALALGLLVRTRLLPLYVLFGMLALAAGGGVLLVLRAHAATAAMLAAVGLLGLGAGATVSPGLWLAGFSLPSKMVGRTFALVELVRSEADYVLAPVVVQVSQVASASTVLTGRGFRVAVWATIGVTLAATVLVAGLFLAGGARLRRPDLEEWLEGEKPALESPALGAGLGSGG